MRIIGGTAKGRVLKTLRGYNVRPTPEKVRESLFQRLGDLQGRVFLDGFAGSGAVGIEALSRMSSRVVFVESDRQAFRCIEENLDRAGFGKERGWKTIPLVSRSGAPLRGLLGQHEEEGRTWVLLHISLMRAIPYLEKTREAFDVLYLDPPYRSDAGLVVLKRLLGSPLLKPGSRVLWEHAAGRQLELARAAGWHAVDTRRFGDTEVTELVCNI